MNSLKWSLIGAGCGVMLLAAGSGWATTYDLSSPGVCEELGIDCSDAFWEVDENSTVDVNEYGTVTYVDVDIINNTQYFATGFAIGIDMDTGVEGIGYRVVSGWQGDILSTDEFLAQNGWSTDTYYTDLFAGYEQVYQMIASDGVGIAAQTMVTDVFQYRLYSGYAACPSIFFTTGGVFGGPTNMANPVSANPVPEPATMLLFGTGLAGLAGLRRRRR